MAAGSVRLETNIGAIGAALVGARHPVEIGLQVFLEGPAQLGHTACLGALGGATHSNEVASCRLAFLISAHRESHFHTIGNSKDSLGWRSVLNFPLRFLFLILSAGLVDLPLQLPKHGLGPLAHPPFRMIVQGAHGLQEECIVVGQ